MQVKKTCNKCKIEKDLNFFPNRKKSIDGKDRSCKDCHKQWSKEYRNKVPSKIRRIVTNKWIENNFERNKAKQKAWNENNKEKVKQTYLNTYKKHRSSKIQKQLKYAKLNPGKVNANSRIRRERQRKSVPKWLSKQQRKEIELFYINCPKGYEVDHIIPIKGKNVCGLHVPWNLQYLTREENRIKSNKF